MNPRSIVIMIKEFRHVVRDWQSLMIVIVMPVVMMFLYGYALSSDMRDVPVIVECPVSSIESTALIRDIDASTLYHVLRVEKNIDNVDEMFRSNRIKALVRIAPDFSEQLKRNGGGGKVQVVIDGSDQNVATTIRNTITPMVQDIIIKTLHITKPTIVTVNQRVLYNPAQESAQFFVPGLMAIILLMISAMLTSLAITREKETGTMEQLLVSPVRPLEILVGKLVPYILIAAVNGIIIMGVGWLVFDIHIAGSSTLLACVSLIYIVAALALGLLFSTIAKTQQQAMLMVLPVTILPTMLLSGFIFPLDSMPWFLQILSKIIPATWFLKAIRGIILKGTGLFELWIPIVVLCGMAAFLMAIALKKFRVRL